MLFELNARAMCALSRRWMRPSGPHGAGFGKKPWSEPKPGPSSSLDETGYEFSLMQSVPIVGQEL
jgi:hypothetical protein